MMSRARSWFGAAALVLAAGCGEAPEAAPGEAPEHAVNPLEASGRLDFFLKVSGAGGTFPGESFTQGRTDQIPGIRFYSNVNKSATGGPKCGTIRFTKAAGNASPAFLRAVSTGEVLKVRMEFVDQGDGGIPFVKQIITIDGVRASKVEQGVAPPEEFVSAAVLEEVSLEPATTAKITVTARTRHADGTAGGDIISPTVSCTK